MKPIKIALVEDRDDIRNAMQILLNSEEGFKCTHVFTNGADAVNQIPKLEIDVVLMDIDLPVLNGIESVKQLKTIKPDLLFMMVTVFEDDEKIFDALAAGASGYILKKTAPARILESITELLAGGSPMNAQIAQRLVKHFQPQIQLNETKEQILSKREIEIIEQLAKGLLYKEIAFILNISIGTVKQHLHRIYEKLHVQNKTEAINKFYRH
ncbi:MAG: response regulator transcription factor [Bacteroidia bacterium]|nr:response regulator transcription factor [Bacteroidia bacterium]HQV00277.1 response regulator transcription factor [Bacteroidia bacterium]